MPFLFVQNPGPLTLIQDAGRLGYHSQGLTNGGPTDEHAFILANRLCGNPLNSTSIEITLGGMELISSANTTMAVTGAEVTLSINGKPKPLWHNHPIAAGDTIHIGYSRNGCRAYLAVAGGFTIAQQFGSTATVTREKIGGLSGTPLKIGDRLTCRSTPPQPHRCLPQDLQPRYPNECSLGLIPGYQFHQFSAEAINRFFSAVFEVSAQADRMGYRLLGPTITSDITTLYSEGIALGSVQITGDGQPIVLLQDRQTIGGYPKMGTVISTDLRWLAQSQAGAKVSFAPINADSALLQVRQEKTQWINCPLDYL